MLDPETRFPDLYKEYRAALIADDLPKAVESSVLIDETTPDIDGLITDFESAIENDETELAQTLLLQLKNEYDERSADEQKQVDRATKAIERGNLTDSERNDLFNLLKEMSRTKLSRSSFLNAAISYLQSDQSQPITEVLNSASETKGAEESLNTTTQTAQTVSESVQLDGTPKILNSKSPSVVVKSESVSLSVIVGNVGDDGTGDLSIQLTKGSDSSTMQDEVSIGTIEPNTQQELNLEVQPSATGIVDLYLTLYEDGSDVESSTESVRVKQESESLRKAITGRENTKLNGAEIQQTMSYWSQNDSIPGTGGKSVSTDKIQDFITEWLEETGADQ